MTHSKVDAVFALRGRDRRRGKATIPSEDLSQAPAPIGQCGIRKVDGVFALCGKGRTSRSSKIDRLSGVYREKPGAQLDEKATISAPRAETSPSLARNDWTKMGEADVAAVAAYGVSKFRDPGKATAFLVAHAGDPAFRKVLVPNGLQPGESVSDLARAAVLQVMAARGWL